MINESLPMLERAIAIASHLHHDQVRRNNQELYINHPLRVMNNIRRNIKNPNEILLVAAILHDVVEDTEYTIEEVTRDFNSDVAEIVSILSKPDEWDLSYMDYIQKIIDSNNTSAMIIKFFDAFDNSIWVDPNGFEKPMKRYIKVMNNLKPILIDRGYYAISNFQDHINKHA